MNDALRAWARGLYPLEAATELLIRTGFARPGSPWVKIEPSGRSAPDVTWIDFAAIPEHAGVLSSGEYRVVMFAASPSGDPDVPPVRLGDLVSVDDRWLTLLSNAVAHAGGHRHAWDRVPVDA
ncbi:MAG TPA: hypothetical protein VGC67_10975 [Cellulomonas sp.]